MGFFQPRLMLRNLFPILSGQIFQFACQECRSPLFQLPNPLSLNRPPKAQPIHLVQLIQRSARESFQQPGINQLVWDFGAVCRPFKSDDSRTAAFPSACNRCTARGSTPPINPINSIRTVSKNATVTSFGSVTVTPSSDVSEHFLTLE